MSIKILKNEKTGKKIFKCDFSVFHFYFFRRKIEWFFEGKFGAIVWASD